MSKDPKDKSFAGAAPPGRGRVQPYPIDCLISRVDAAANAPAFEAQIIRLEEIGLLAKTTSQYFKLGDLYICNFEIPVLKDHIMETIKIIKTAESAEAYFGKANVMQKIITVEFHFKGLSLESRKAINHFTHKIGQKKSA